MENEQQPKPKEPRVGVIAPLYQHGDMACLLRLIDQREVWVCYACRRAFIITDELREALIADGEATHASLEEREADIPGAFLKAFGARGEHDGS